MNPIEEDVGIERAGDEQRSHQILHTVDAKEPRETCIELVERPHHKGQQRMAIDLIDDIPVGYGEIGQRVIARQVQLPLKHLPVRAEARLHEQVVHAPDKQAVEYNNQHQCHQRLQPLLGLHSE